jgi:hypothetical protein
VNVQSNNRFRHKNCSLLPKGTIKVPKSDAFAESYRIDARSVAQSVIIGTASDLFEAECCIETARRIVRPHFQKHAIGTGLAGLAEKGFEKLSAKTVLAKPGAHSDKQQFLLSRRTANKRETRRLPP